MDRQIEEFLGACEARYDIPREQAAALLRRSPPEQLREKLEGTVLLFNLLVNWRLAGRQLFHLQPDLVARLVDTSVKAPAELVRLPFPTVMLVFNDQHAFQAFDGPGAKIEPKQGALSVIVSELEVDGERRLTLGATRANGRRMTRQVYRSLLLRDGWTTEQSISTDWGRLGAAAGGLDSYFLNQGMALSRLVLNTILYLGSASARMSGIMRNHPSTHNDTRNFSFLRHRRVGDGITYLQGPGGTADGSGADGVSGGDARRLSARHFVMGHWKSQPFGKGGALRQPIWIEPYIRGPDAAEVLDRKYVVR